MLMVPVDCQMVAVAHLGQIPAVTAVHQVLQNLVILNQVREKANKLSHNDLSICHNPS